MATLEQLMDIEANTEAPFKSYLQTLVTAASIYRSDENVQNQTPSIRLVSSLVEQGNHQITIATGTYTGRPVYDMFRVRTTFDLVYDPSFSQGQANLRSQLRVGLSAYAAIATYFSASGYLVLAPDTLRQIDGSRTIDDQSKEETINFTMEGIYFFNSTALASLS